MIDVIEIDYDIVIKGMEETARAIEKRPLIVFVNCNNNSLGLVCLVRWLFSFYYMTRYQAKVYTSFGASSADLGSSIPLFFLSTATVFGLDLSLSLCTKNRFATNFGSRSV